jgi:serine phosphatase RsbU (regulator of sigma subunit)/FixJ family two-component response regulator/anti-sigma regulatory factor (Ser/Thr protein kinase)
MPAPEILIVDDDRALLDALSETLRLRMPDVAVDVAESGPLALDRIKVADYDAIVADIRMPGMDGLALVGEIRVLRPDTPTLLITGHGEHDLAIEAVRRGAYDYILKPIDREYFVASLRRAIKMYQLKRQVEEQRQALERHASELAEQVGALTEVAAAIHEARGIKDVMQSVARAGTRLTGGVVVVGVLRGEDGSGSANSAEDRSAPPDRWEVVSSPPEAMAHLEYLGVPTLLDVTATGRRMTRADEIETDGHTSSVASYLAVPIISPRGHARGAIWLGHHEAHRFSPSLQPQIEALARQAAIALENALHNERQRGIVETLQRSLLPERLPSIPGVTLAARYLPGPPDAIGGDWYDVFSLPGGRLGLVMGDVAGRGVGAGAVMGQLRNALRAYAMEGHPPEAVAGHLRDLVNNGTMATLIYLVFELGAWTLRYVNLGHLPPAVLTPTGVFTWLEGGSPPLGVGPPFLVTEQTVALVPGSIVFLYTDGLIEVRGEPLDEGMSRLKATLAQHGAAADLEQLIDETLARVLEGRLQEDDVALLVMRAAALDPAGLGLRLPAIPSSLPVLRDGLRRWLKVLSATADETFEITVAAGEALTNAIEHAYGLRDAVVEITARSIDGQIEIVVRDQGRWRSPRGESRGRGLKVMEHFMDAVYLSGGSDGTTVRMRRALRRKDIRLEVPR